MKKVTLAFLVLISTMNCSPVFGQDKIINNTTEYVEDFTELVNETNNLDPIFADLIINYSKKEQICIGDNVNVRSEPNTNSMVLGQLMKDVTVESIAEYDNWTCITTEDGIAFVCSDYLIDNEQNDNSSLNRWGIKLSESEYDTLCRIVMLESGGQRDLGQQAVTETILNRVVHYYYPNNIIDVLSQVDCGYVQFSTWKNRNSEKATPSERVKQNVSLVLSGQTNILPMNTVYFSREPSNNKIQAHIEDHYFCNY